MSFSNKIKGSSIRCNQFEGLASLAKTLGPGCRIMLPNNVATGVMERAHVCANLSDMIVYCKSGVVRAVTFLPLKHTRDDDLAEFAQWFSSSVM